jgi:hypothetical protein
MPKFKPSTLVRWSNKGLLSVYTSSSKDIGIILEFDQILLRSSNPQETFSLVLWFYRIEESGYAKDIQVYPNEWLKALKHNNKENNFDFEK